MKNKHLAPCLGWVHLKGPHPQAEPKSQHPRARAARGPGGARPAWFCPLSAFRWALRHCELRRGEELRSGFSQISHGAWGGRGGGGGGGEGRRGGGEEGRRELKKALTMGLPIPSPSTQGYMNLVNAETSMVSTTSFWFCKQLQLRVIPLILEWSSRWFLAFHQGRMFKSTLGLSKHGILLLPT